MKQKILLVAGGYSNEREISLKTAKSVSEELKKNKKYSIKFVEPDGNFIKKIKTFKPNIVFNLLHGRYGEDGYIQAILESQKVKYTHSGVLSSSLAIDKEISKKIYLKNKILTPKYIKYNFKSLTLIQLLKRVEKKLSLKSDFIESKIYRLLDEFLVSEPHQQENYLPARLITKYSYNVLFGT